MTATLEPAGTTDGRTVEPVRAARRRTGLLTVLGDALAAARAVRTADAHSKVAVAARFAERISA